MDWIKKHYDQFTLGLLALALLVLSVMLILRTQGFGEGFSVATAVVPPKTKVPPLVLKTIEEARETLKNPPQWDEASSRPDPASPTAPEKRGKLLASDLYIIDDKTKEPVPPDKITGQLDSLTKKEIPSTWLLQHNISVLDLNAAKQDSDKDGFLVEDEWRGVSNETPGVGSTDPNNKDSHPPYHTKLFVKQFVRIPFRLKFNSYDGDPKTGKPETFEFQINTIDLQQPSEFLKIGETIKNTRFKIKGFKHEVEKDPGTGDEVDVSKLTLTNIDTNLDIVLTLNRITDEPFFFMDFVYKWTNPETVFRVKKGQEFVLKPNITEKYKLIDSAEGKAVIQTPDGKQVTIIPDPRR